MCMCAFLLFADWLAALLGRAFTSHTLLVNRLFVVVLHFAYSPQLRRIVVEVVLFKCW